MTTATDSLRTELADARACILMQEAIIADLRTVITNKLNSIVGPDKRHLLAENAALRSMLEERRIG